ncbi:hypothetical protein BCR33DRAFT_723177 [Rhizoclosmatium globosum]|uniref:DUF599-domain-containing protein n=1 Tax=Rhizoclosmatium globosum TaxID=329046 RepID=A0A1Y2BHK4_9FUNG|nr:hypothetical protein BCR33DRAFT_723177 [Rhizoclosmatium globosum]|eukprot:ORY33605.1 hypothetical protein BCR33DRAFT_723177 [Rhizoclosmatium globosum]
MDEYAATNIAVGTACVSPEKTVYGLSALSRKVWVAAIMRGQNKDILAVQSLRNLIMASSILASTCVAIIFGFIAFLATVVSHPESVATIGNPLGSQFGFALDQLFGTKVMMLLIVFCVAFFCFAQSMRFYNHVGLVININISIEELEDAFRLKESHLPDEEDDHGRFSEDHSTHVDISDSRKGRSPIKARPHTDEITRERAESKRSFSNLDALNVRDATVDKHSDTQHRRDRHLNAHSRAANVEFVARMLNRGSMFYTLGMRGYYISFPVMGYLWGPWALLLTTLLLTLSPTQFREEQSKLDADVQGAKSLDKGHGKSVAGPSKVGDQGGIVRQKSGLREMDDGTVLNV